MSKSSDNKKQQLALKKLRSSGLYTGKLPRGKATPYQARLIRKFDAVVKGRAAVVEPSKARDYKGIFQTAGKKVIVPRQRGEKITTNKKGNIVRTRKGPRGEKITATLHRARKPGELPPTVKEPTVFDVPHRYAVPFARKIAKGQYRLEWHRFPTLDALKKFMAEYEKERYPDWRNFVLVEAIDNKKTTAQLNQELQDQALALGMAKSSNEFESMSSPIMRHARKMRRNKQRRRWRGK